MKKKSEETESDLLHSPILIQWTCASLEEARAISKDLLKERKVACASFIPHIESHFRWEGNLQTTEEVKVIFKTTKKHFDAIKNFILEFAEYEVPEILQLPITKGSEEYLKWLIQSVSE